MELTHSPSLPQKCPSFSAPFSSREDKIRSSDRNLSLSFHPISETSTGDVDGENRAENGNSQDPEGIQGEEQDDNDGDIFNPSDLASLSIEIDQFLARELVPEASIPEAAISRFAALIEEETAKRECSDDPTFLDSVNRASKLTAALSSDPQHYQCMNQIGSALHGAMAFLEDEFHSLLSPPDPFSKSTDLSLPNASQTVARLRSIASAMISAGYETECCQVFTIARRNAMHSALCFEKKSIDDVLHLPWETLESEISSWTKSLSHALSSSFPHERDLCESVFEGPHQFSIAGGIIRNLARGVLIQLLNFVEAVAMTKRSAEKLFKILDMYETLRDAIPELDLIFPPNAPDGSDDIKLELSSVRARLGEAAVSIFCDLEISIKSETAKSPVPGGAVHPLTRYVMNYLKYACEYSSTLEQIFKQQRSTSSSSSSCSSCNDEGDGGGEYSSESSNRSPFASQVIQVMQLLGASLDAKAKLYRDLSLSSIFMMNNGRYIVQKIKGTAEIKDILGEAWCRKKSSDLRQFHKNYQRETWNKLLNCLKDEGLQQRGGVVKPVLKERFKNFNSMFEEIHKTQSGWVVSDEQLRSELRVSISSVVVPAYRSFLGRFSQYLAPGRQKEKYVKFGPEELESCIEDLFDANPAATLKRKP